jgi:hypothetical protein
MTETPYSNAPNGCCERRGGRLGHCLVAVSDLYRISDFEFRAFDNATAHLRHKTEVNQ